VWGAVASTCTVRVGLVESSIFVGESRGLDHSNCLRTALISTIDNILKALKLDFYDFLSCFGTHFYAVL
jgi:hypothetical protein